MFNGNATDFVVSQNGKSGAARFLFATEGGTIMGWSPGVNATVAVTAADRSAAGAIYKGLAIANDKLYASDFHNGRVDVFDKSFNLVSGGFTDPKVPAGLRTVRDPGARRQHLRDLRQAGCGEEGRRRGARPGIRQRIHPGRHAGRTGRQLGQEECAAERRLGLALAPADFGAFAGDLLVGNFGNGRISAYSKSDTKWVYKASFATPTAPRSRSTGSGRSRSATAPPPGRRTRSTSSPAQRRNPRPLRIDHHRLADSKHSGLGTDG